MESTRPACCVGAKQGTCDTSLWTVSSLDAELESVFCSDDRFPFRFAFTSDLGGIRDRGLSALDEPDAMEVDELVTSSRITRDGAIDGDGLDVEFEYLLSPRVVVVVLEGATVHPVCSSVGSISFGSCVCPLAVHSPLVSSTCVCTTDASLG